MKATNTHTKYNRLFSFIAYVTGSAGGAALAGWLLLLLVCNLFQVDILSDGGGIWWPGLTRFYPVCWYSTDKTKEPERFFFR